MPAKRLQFLVEGQTEEIIVDSLLVPHFRGLGWTVGRPTIVKTKLPAGGPAHRGGVSTWPRLRREIERLLGSGFDIVTTVVDYYGFPNDAPGMADRPRGSDARARVEWVEAAVAAEIGSSRFLPHLSLHETEAWVFAAADQLAALYPADTGLADFARAIAKQAGGPELINDAPATAPSKRLSQRIPFYRKTTDGPLAVADLGLPALRDACPHLHAWLAAVEAGL
jgi:hypothetical protein